MTLNYNRLNENVDSESGTTIHKASLKSGAFSFPGYGRFLVTLTTDAAALPLESDLSISLQQSPAFPVTVPTFAGLHTANKHYFQPVYLLVN